MTLAARPESSGTPLAVALVIMASALIAATSIIAKQLGIDGDDAPGLSPFQVSAGRFFFAFSGLILFMSFQPKFRPSFKGAKWRFHITRALFGWMGVTCMFTAVARMPVADATAIGFLNPLITVILAVWLFKDRLGLRELAAIFIALVGALLVLRPGTDAFQFAGLFALGAALFIGCEVVVVKVLSDSEPAPRILLINNMIGASVSLVTALFVWQWPSMQQWVLLVFLGVAMVSAQALFIQGMKRGKASIVAPIMYSVLVFSALYDWMIFAVVPTSWVAAGSALIVGSALLLAFKKSS